MKWLAGAERFGGAATERGAALRHGIATVLSSCRVFERHGAAQDGWSGGALHFTSPEHSA
jgi:hypothetical protein